MRIAELSRADVDAVERLLADDGGYAGRVFGRSTDAADALAVLAERPPGTAAPAKCVLGLFDDGDLVGLADVIRGWPAPDQAHVGLLQIAATRQGRGLGRVLHGAVTERVRTWPEITTLRLGVVDTNHGVAERFWRAMGYTPTGEAMPFDSGTVRSVTRIWTRQVPS